MASEVDISNLALSRLGDNATVASINPPEGSVQAEHCARFYPIARDSMLEAHAWKFATRRMLLTPMVRESWDWTYAYAAPNGIIRMIAVLPRNDPGDATTREYEVESDAAGALAILTNQEAATLRYIARVTDTTKFSPLFVDALAWLLASHLAGPILKGDSGLGAARSCYATFKTVFSQAATSDANQRKVQPKHVPSWIGVR